MALPRTVVLVVKVLVSLVEVDARAERRPEVRRSAADMVAAELGGDQRGDWIIQYAVLRYGLESIQLCVMTVGVWEEKTEGWTARQPRSGGGIYTELLH